MFGLSCNKGTPVGDAIMQKQGEEAIPFPAPARIPLRLVEAEKQRAYEEVAQSLGFEPAELVRAQLLAFCDEEGIGLYAYNQVSAWLTEKKRQANADNWCWRALREQDIITDYSWGYNYGSCVSDDGFYRGKSWQCRPYDRLVPFHALERVADIETRFKDRVKFFVSNYVVPNVASFIMVRPTMPDSGSNEYSLIFDAWDMPGFGI